MGERQFGNGQTNWWQVPPTWKNHLKPNQKYVGSDTLPKEVGNKQHQTTQMNTLRKTTATLLAAISIAMFGAGFVSESQAQYGAYRIGAICNDGTQSSATGSGACSWHGGVSCWLYSDGSCR